MRTMIAAAMATTGEREADLIAALEPGNALVGWGRGRDWRDHLPMVARRAWSHLSLDARLALFLVGEARAAATDDAGPAEIACIGARREGVGGAKSLQDLASRPSAKLV